MRLFPDLPGRIDGDDEENQSLVVNDFTASEVVLDGATVQIGKTPKVDAEWTLIVWHDERQEHEKPVVVDLSYRYGDKNEGYGGGVTRRAFDIFNIVQPEFENGWTRSRAQKPRSFFNDSRPQAIQYACRAASDRPS
jgi:hypothetical protein